MTLDVDQLDFDHCEDEPIHIPESIQGYGYLFALDRDRGRIEIVSENIGDFLEPGTDVIGRGFFDLLDPAEATFAFLEETFERARQRPTRLPVQIRFRPDMVRAGHSTDFLAVVYDSADRFIIELEPAAGFRELYSAQHYLRLYAVSVAPKFKMLQSLAEMAQEIVDTIRYVTGMDRVVLYRFNDDHSGKVIAESRVDDIESYLDVYYPASDIPAQARELYKKNWVRITPDVDLEPSNLYPSAGDAGRAPLDMTHSILRTLSPIHRQYVRNQGLRASMSMSLVTHDRLWGMISCHSRQATYVPQNVRLECENISQLFSWHLYAKEEELAHRKRQRIDDAANRMLSYISSNRPISRVFRENEQEVLEILDADGFVYHSPAEVVSLGEIPDIEVVRQIYRHAAAAHNRPFVTTDVSRVVDPGDGLGDIRGVLLVPLLEQGDHFTAWFRKEQRLVQKWAGAPEEKSANASKRDRLMPRSSFEVHVREVSGFSRAWDDSVVDMAERFNRVFTAYALETQERMRRNISDLRKQDEYKNAFLATLAHELRNPLGPISAGLAVLEASPAPSAGNEVIDRMKRQVGHMKTMIEDLMQVARITNGKVRLDQEVLDLRDIVREVLAGIDPQVSEKNHTLTVDLPAEALPVCGDRTRLGQVFFNLLNNATKYTDSGGHIQVRARLIDDQVAVIIKDDGVGIEPENVELIFAMFTQIDAQSDRTRGGIGIGLTLAERLVALHGGTISARSEGLGHGAEFEVRLPAEASGVSAIGQEAAAPEPKAASVRKRVLVVDDVEDIVATYKVLLEIYGYEVETASAADQAAAVFARFQPQVALLDIGMPDTDGYELCRILTALPGGSDCVFYSQSGWGKERDFQRSREAGFREHLVKPLEPDRLRELLERTVTEG